MEDALGIMAREGKTAAHRLGQENRKKELSWRPGEHGQ